MSESKSHSSRNANHEPMDEGSDNEETESSGSASTLTTGTENNTSRSNTPTLGNNANRPGTNKKTGQKARKRKRWSTSAKSQKYVPTNSKYSYSCMAKEDHGQPIFGAQFHHRLKPGEPLILATVGSNRVSIYECIPEGSLKILQVYADPDPEENFYTCAWTDDYNTNNKPGSMHKSLLAAAGARGVIRVFAPATGQCIKHYLGHGHAINHLVFHPKNSNLLLSASKDHSLRLWNIKTDFLIASFGGIDGHRDEVLAADINLAGTRIVSSGMDHSLKVWKLNKPEIEEACKLSNTYNPKSSRPFPTVIQNFPDYSTRDVHRNYVDCAKWFGDFLLSKSCENTIVCWKGGKTFQKWDEITTSTTETTVIHRFEIKECDIWFMRFGLDFEKKTLALGNQNGKTYIYDLTVKEPSQIKSTVLSHPKCTTAIRQTALSRDGSVLICVCDDSTVWRWDVIKDEDENEN